MANKLFGEARKKANLSLEDVAKLLDTTVCTVKNLENDLVGHQAFWVRKKACVLFGISDKNLFPDKK